MQDHALEHSLPLVRCFGAWVKWGCLEYIEPVHADYFTRVAGALLLGGHEASVAVGARTAARPPPVEVC